MLSREYREIEKERAKQGSQEPEVPPLILHKVQFDPQFKQECEEHLRRKKGQAADDAIFQHALAAVIGQASTENFTRVKAATNTLLMESLKQQRTSLIALFYPWE